MVIDIDSNRGKNIISPYEHIAINWWMNSVPREYIKRNITVVPSYVASHSLKELCKLHMKSNQIFIKSLFKGWSYTGSLEGWEDSRDYDICINEDDIQPIMFSDYIEFDYDDIDTKEYRCFYIDKKLRSISRYTDDESHMIPNEAVSYAKDIEKNLVGRYLPNSVVVDIGETKDNGYLIVECNDVSCSGRYLYNTPKSLFEEDIFI